MATVTSKKELSKVVPQAEWLCRTQGVPEKGEGVHAAAR